MFFEWCLNDALSSITSFLIWSRVRELYVFQFNNYHWLVLHIYIAVIPLQKKKKFDHISFIL